MTEDDWLNCNDLYTLLCQVQDQYSRRKVLGKASERKLRLLACACCYRIWPLLTYSQSRDAVVMGERYADGKVTQIESNRACRAAGAAHSHACADWDGDWATLNDPLVPATLAAFYCGGEADTQFDEYTPFIPDAADVTRHCVHAVTLAHGADAGQSEAAAQRALFHDIVANPFQPTDLDRKSLPVEIVMLARTIYIERAFPRLPELAAALESAGQTNPHILAQCRSAAPHVRGCWVIDQILGKQ